MTSNVFDRGVPTDGEINALEKALGIPEVGTRLSYNLIGTLINSGYPTTRFRTVTDRWRTILERDHNLLLVCVPGEKCFEVANAHDRIKQATHRTVKGFRSIARGAHLAARTDRSALTQDERRQQDHICRIATMVAQARKTTPKKIVYKPEME